MERTNDLRINNQNCNERILKTVNPFFQQVWDGLKTAELRYLLDRDFQLRQEWVLYEYNPFTKEFGHRAIVVVITDILKDYQGLQEGYGMISFNKLRHIQDTSSELLFI